MVGVLDKTNCTFGRFLLSPETHCDQQKLYTVLSIAVPILFVFIFIYTIDFCLYRRRKRSKRYHTRNYNKPKLRVGVPLNTAMTLLLAPVVQQVSQADDTASASFGSFRKTLHSDRNENRGPGLSTRKKSLLKILNPQYQSSEHEQTTEVPNLLLDFKSQTSRSKEINKKFFKKSDTYSDLQQRTNDSETTLLELDKNRWIQITKL